MRFVSAEHEFSWNGTLTIVAIFAIFGSGQALAAVARRGGWTGRGRAAALAVGVASAVPLGMGAGAIMWPSTMIGALALGRNTMNARVRLVLAVVALGLTGMALQELVAGLPARQAGLGWGLMFGVYLPIVWALSRTMRAIGPLRIGLTRNQKLGLVALAGALVTWFGVSALGLTPGR